MGNIQINPAVMGDKNQIVFQFDTSGNSSASIDINSVISGRLRWDVSGIINYSSGDILVSGLPTTGFTVKCYKSTSSGGKTIPYLNLNGLDVSGTLDVSSLVRCRDYRLNSCSLTNVVFPDADVSVIILQLNTNSFSTLDLRPLKHLGGDIQILTNPKLKTIYFPESSTHVTNFSIADSSISVLDISAMNGLGGNFNLNRNSSLNTVNFPSSDVSFYNFQIQDCSLLNGTLDLSGLKGLGGQIVFNNLNVSKIVFPTSPTKITLLRSANGTVSSYHSKLTGVLDVSGLSGLGGIFDVNSQPLTGILNPESSVVFLNYYVNSCNLTGTHDMSRLSGLGGGIRLQTNPQLNYIINPSSNELITNYQAFSCDLSGNLDMTGLKRLAGTIALYSNPKLNNIFFTSSSDNINLFDARFCNLFSIDISSLKLNGIVSLGSNPKLSSITLPTYDTSLLSLGFNDCSIQGVFDVSVFKSLNQFYAPNNRLTEVIFPLSTTNAGIDITLYKNDISTDVFDLTMFKNILNISLGTSSGNKNPHIGTILFPPDSSATSTIISAYYCGLDGTLNLNGLKNLYRLECPNNPNLTNIIGAKSSFSSGLYTVFLQSCNLTGTLDISSLKNFYDQFWFFSNPNLTNILHADASLYRRNITSYYAHTCNLTGTLDLSGAYPYFSSEFLVYNNPNLTNIIQPENSANISTYYAFNTGIQNLDFTKFHNFGGTIQINNTPNLTSVKFPGDSKRYTTLLLYDSSITGVLDASNSYFSGQFRIHNNPNLTGIIFGKDSSLDLGVVDIYNCPSLASLDLSPLKKLGVTSALLTSAILNIYNNPNLTTIKFPDSSNHFIQTNLYNCNLTGTLDLSTWVGFGNNSPSSITQFNVSKNYNLTNIIFPKTNYYLGNFNCTSCNLTGTIDASGLYRIGHFSSSTGIIDFSDNPNLENVLFDASLSNVKNIKINNCNLTGALDLSKFKNISNSFSIQAYNNPNLENVLIPDTSSIVASFILNDCSLDTIDLSGVLTNYTTQLHFYNNNGLYNIILPNTSIGYLFLHDCSLSSIDVNNVLLNLSTYSATPLITTQCSLNGGNNAPIINGDNNAYIQSLKTAKVNYFQWWINYEVSAFFTMPISNRNSTQISLTSWSGNIFDIEYGDGYGKYHQNAVTTGIVNLPPKLIRKFNLYDGSTSGANDVKRFYYYISDDYSILDLRVFKALQECFIDFSYTITDVFLPDSSNFNNFRIDDTSFGTTIDLSTYNNLTSIILNNVGSTFIKNPSSLSSMTSYQINDCYNVNEIDLSNIKLRDASNSTIQLNHNKKLDSLILPLDPSTSFISGTINDTSIYTLDLSAYVTNIPTITNNPNLSSIFLPKAASVISINLSNNNLSTLDASHINLYNMANLRVEKNKNLTSILMPKTSISTFYAFDCSLNGVLDVSVADFGDSYYAAGGIDFRVQNNSNLTSIILSPLAYSIRYFIANDCALDASTVDKVFKIIYDYNSINPPTFDASIYLDGGTNSPPTDGSSNFNIVMCVSIFNNVGRNFDYRINY